jgi:hypothetical protein
MDNSEWAEGFATRFGSDTTSDRGREADVAARLEAARLIRERRKAPSPRG